jgi:hypothetical protein
MTPLPDSDETPAPSLPPVRASDDDRLATVRELQDAVGKGLLTPDECSDRMAAAFAAVHVHELAPLTEDLPPAPAGPTAAPGWRVLGLLAAAQLRAALTTPGTGRPRPVRIALVVLLASLLLAAVSWSVGDLVFDGGGGDGFGRDFDGFDRFDDD